MPAASDRFAPATSTAAPAPSTPDTSLGEHHGLVTLSDYRKRRAEILNAQGRDALRIKSGTGTEIDVQGRDRIKSGTATPAEGEEGDDAALVVDEESDAGDKKKCGKKKRKAKGMLSFEDGDDAEDDKVVVKKKKRAETEEDDSAKITANMSLEIIPRLQSRANLRREAAAREALRAEFLVLQAAVRASEIAVPFVFHDGTDLPGGMVRVRKGDPVWLFLDRGRKVGATRAAAAAVGGSRANMRARREWARVSVDDLMLVRGTIIIPPHYEIYYFILNQTVGPGGRRLFNYSGDAPLPTTDTTADPQSDTPDLLSTATAPPPPVDSLEGASDDPSFTKVVNRRWYERNKHIYPASLWQEFDPEKDYRNEIKRDLGGNTFFFSG